MWEPFNHSLSEICLRPAPAKQKPEVIRAVTGFGIHASDLSAVELVVETAASSNFKVSRLGTQPLLLRVNYRINTELAVGAVDGLSRYLACSEYIAWDGKYGLKPLGKPRRSDWGGAARWVQLYPYVECDRYYSGGSLAQVQSAGKAFGELQRALAEAPTPEWFDILAVARPDLDERGSLLEAYKEVPEWIDSSGDPIARFLQGKKAQLELVFSVTDGADASPSDGVPSYADYHPHNALFRDNSCVLICDLESCIVAPSREPSVAFATHRFVREYVRQRLAEDPTDVREHITAGVRKFIEGYEAGGASVDSGFAGRFLGHAVRLNARKLFHVCERHRGGDEQSSARSLEEVQKFVTFMEEVEQIDSFMEGQSV